MLRCRYCLRVARRMSLIALAAPVWRVCNFCLIFVPFGHYDEPETLPYEIRLVCSIGADVKHSFSAVFPYRRGARHSTCQHPRTSP